MKKRLLALTLALMMALSLLPAAAFAARGDFNIADNGTLVSYNGTGGRCDHPSGCDQHWRECVPGLQKPDRRDHPGGRDQH